MNSLLGPLRGKHDIIALFSDKEIEAQRDLDPCAKFILSVL